MSQTGAPQRRRIATRFGLAVWAALGGGVAGCSGGGDTLADAGPKRVCDGADALSEPSIRAFVASLQHGFAYEPMSIAQTNGVRGATRSLAAGNVDDARAQAEKVGYQVSSLRAASECYWLMRPTNQGPHGQATLVIATTFDRDLVVEAPHVPNDLHTDTEAAIVFSAVGARALIIAGAQRCAVATPSGCHSNFECNATGVAVESDPSHSVDNALHAMHLGLVTGATSTIALQLHTNIVPSLNGAALVSNGTRDPIAGTMADALYAALRAPDVDVRSCNDPAAPPQAKAFCGEKNAQSLASNGANDACLGSPHQSGGAANHRFIQLEQESQRLQAVDEWSARVATAVKAAIPAGH